MAKDIPVMPEFFDPINWMVIGTTGFCLLTGTLVNLFLIPSGALADHESVKWWSEVVLLVAFFTGFGFIGGAFKGFYSAVGYYQEGK